MSGWCMGVGTGQNACKQCTPCGAGEEPFGDGCTVTANQQCQKCPAGKAKDTDAKGSDPCTACVKGSTYQDALGMWGGDR